MPKALKGFQKGHQLYGKPFTVGHDVSDEVRRKMVENHVGMLGRKHSEETKQKIRVAVLEQPVPFYKFSSWLGQHHSEEAKAKMRKPHNISLEVRRMMSERNEGPRSRFWKGGISRGENRKGYYRQKRIERAIREAGNSGSHTFAEWTALKAKYGFSCPRCFRKEPDILLTADHILPVSLGGDNSISNIQPLCLGCNSSKHVNVICYELFLSFPPVSQAVAASEHAKTMS